MSYNLYNPTPTIREPIVPTPPDPIEPEEPITPDPTPEPDTDPVVEPVGESVLELFLAALSAGHELPVITPKQFDRLKVEINTSLYTPYDLQELEAGRFKGHGFGVDHSKEEQ